MNSDCVGGLVIQEKKKEKFGFSKILWCSHITTVILKITETTLYGHGIRMAGIYPSSLHFIAYHFLWYNM